MKNMTNQTLKSIFSFHLPNLISNDAALLAGILSSFMLVFIFRKSTFIISQKLEYFIKIYIKMLIPLMPLFIIGTALKLQTEGTLSQIFEKYTPVLILFIISAYGWVLLQLYMISKLNFSKLTSYIKKITPAATTAFSTASSASALPLSIKAAEQNISQKINASIIIPTTVNIHLVGDCFFIPMIALVIMHSFGLALPEISNYLLFAIHFCLAKFAVAAIPGGGIIVMLPILQEYLGFQTDMQAIITAIYILFDPIITGCNVIGNGAMAIVFDKIVSQKTR
ncbi:MAG: cation:dicarboxylase symporter family transporter [Holosporales bacterium]|jgi:Na+/H+-dicarboxylate symporter|nr:cation:dicarboxylase symporter family transporter [Holosporales bacterium]